MRGIMTARTKPVRLYEPVAVENLTEIAGFEKPAPRAACKYVDPENPAQLDRTSSERGKSHLITFKEKIIHMSVLVYTENWDGKFKKLSYELVSYASSVAGMLNTKVIALTIGKADDDELERTW